MNLVVSICCDGGLRAEVKGRDCLRQLDNKTDVVLSTQVERMECIICNFRSEQSAWNVCQVVVKEVPTGWSRF